VRLMGRAASHITLEVALQTHPNIVLLGEEIEANKMTLIDIVRYIADVVAARAAQDKNFGVVLVPEGAISYIPELRTLISEMNRLFADGVAPEGIPARLTPWSQAVLSYLPALIRQQLFLERESSGAVQLSQISTEKLLAELVGDELARRKVWLHPVHAAASWPATCCPRPPASGAVAPTPLRRRAPASAPRVALCVVRTLRLRHARVQSAGTFKGKYASISHFFGYQARSSLPSNFDCKYGTALGGTAAALIIGGYTGYMATVTHLNKPLSQWLPVGVPLSAMMTVPTPGTVLAQAYATTKSSAGDAAGHTGVRPVIESSPVDVHGATFQVRGDSRAAQGAVPACGVATSAVVTPHSLVRACERLARVCALGGQCRR
jgi:6-phosphofructokinase